MAIVATAVKANRNYKSWTLTALDADTSLTLAHGFGVQPDMAMIQCQIAASATDGVNQWNVSADATNLTITKTTASGSGGASPGTTIAAKVWAERPHTATQ